MVKSKNQLLTFLKENLIIIILLIVLTIFTYGFKLFYYSFSIDTETMINTPEILLDSWLGIGRYGLVLIKQFLFLIPINVMLANWLTAILLPFSIIMWLYCFEKISNGNQNKMANFIFCALIITSPLWGEQFGFTLQIFEVTLALLLEAIALILVNKWILYKKNIYFIIGTLLLSFCFGCYQSFISLFITGVVISYLIIIDRFDYKGTKNYVNLFIKYVTVFILAFALFMISDILVNNFFVVNKNEYLNNKIAWRKEPIITTIINVGYYGVSTLLGMKMPFQPFYLIIGIYYFIKQVQLYFKKKTSLIFTLFPAFFLLVTPYLIPIVTGAPIPARSQFGMVFILGFLGYYFVRKYNNKLSKIFCLFVLIVQLGTSTMMFYSDLHWFNSDKKLAFEIINDINEKYDSSKPVVFVGSYTPENPNILIRSETLGNSFFSWDVETESGINIRVAGFANSLGLTYVSPTLDQIIEGRELALDMTVYPNEGYIKETDSLIIVKLSD